MGKIYWCRNCKVHPSFITEVYLEPIKEKRMYDKDTDDYNLIKSNLDDVNMQTLCTACGGVLEINPEEEKKDASNMGNSRNKSRKSNKGI